MLRREFLVGIAGIALGVVLGIGTMISADGDEIDDTYHRLWNNIRTTETFREETTRKPDIVRLIVWYDGDGSSLYNIALCWRREGHSDLLSSEPVGDKQLAYRLLYGISNRYQLPCEMNLPSH